MTSGGAPARATAAAPSLACTRASAPNSARELQLGVTSTDGNHGGPEMLADLDRVAADSAGPDDREGFARLQPGDPGQCVERRGQSVGGHCDLRGVHLGHDRYQGVQGSDDVIGKRSVGVDAHPRDVGTKILQSAPIPGGVGRAADVVEGDLHSHPVLVGVVPDRHHTSRRFVSGNDGELVRTETSLLQEDIGTAHSTCLDADECFGRFGRAQRLGCADERRIHRSQNECASLVDVGPVHNEYCNGGLGCQQSFPGTFPGAGVKRSVAVVHPYWDFWEHSVPGSFRADREELLRVVSAALADEFTVLASVLVSNSAEAANAASDCLGADAVVLLSTMAAPAATSMALLDRLPNKPVVVWAFHEQRTLPPDFSHSDITTRGATVGAPMIVSALARAGRRSDVVMTTLEEMDPALLAIRCAAAAGSLRGAKVLRIGSPMPGYTSVIAGDDELAGLGITGVVVDPAELASRARSISTETLAGLRDAVEEEFDVDPAVSGQAVDRSLRVEAASPV